MTKTYCMNAWNSQRINKMLYLFFLKKYKISSDLSADPATLSCPGLKNKLSSLQMGSLQHLFGSWQDVPPGGTWAHARPQVLTTED